MRRREFITLLGGAAAAWPLAARAQQAGRKRRIGVLMAYAENDREYQSHLAAFREELQKLGWTEDRNVQFDYRWAALDPEVMRRFARELIALQPDVILSSSSPTTAFWKKRTASPSFSLTSSIRLAAALPQVYLARAVTLRVSCFLKHR
jgi:putative ABC transport system substrate-binding protein